MMATMRDVARLLGVEIGEKFDIKSNDETYPEPEEYNGLMITDKGLDQRFSGVILEQLFNGEYSVVKRQYWQRERI